MSQMRAHLFRLWHPWYNGSCLPRVSSLPSVSYVFTLLALPP
jgi:hypothetical protein